MSLRHAILAAISSKPQTGYELGAEMEGSICFFWNATRQQIYKELGDLEGAAWVGHKDVRQEERPDKKIYHITSEGLKELKDWIGKETDRAPVRDALLIKVFVGHLVPHKTLLKEMQNQQKINSEKLKLFMWLEEKYLNGPNASVAKYHFQYLALRRGIIVITAWLDWAKEVISYLEGHIALPRKSRSHPGVSRA